MPGPLGTGTGGGAGADPCSPPTWTGAMPHSASLANSPYSYIALHCIAPKGRGKTSNRYNIYKLLLLDHWVLYANVAARVACLACAAYCSCSQILYMNMYGHKLTLITPTSRNSLIEQELGKLGLGGRNPNRRPETSGSALHTSSTSYSYLHALRPSPFAATCSNSTSSSNSARAVSVFR